MALSLHRDLEDLHPVLMRFAVRQLRNDTLALFAVLEKPDRFTRQSEEANKEHGPE